MTSQSLMRSAMEWGCEQLVSSGYTLKSNFPETVKVSPWSFVTRFETSEGYIYLKQMPELIALEPLIIKMLHEQFNASVPEIIAQNTELHCFLMKDAGRSLRDISKQQFDASLFCKAVEQFAALQLAVADQVGVFLEIGVPDWRLINMPDLYQELLSQKIMLLDDGLTESETDRLQASVSKVDALCKRLSEHAIKESIVQPDFNDNNTLVNDALDVTTIDLGEIVISHPFFSFANCLKQMEKHHGLTSNDSLCLKIRDAYFKHYLPFHSMEELSDAFELVQKLRHVYEALGQYRLMNACDREELMAFQRGKLSDSLRECLCLF